jgi:hypothetical protein
VYNIQKAVSRLEFAPKLKEIEVTDFKKGLGVFTPKPEKAVSFAALKQSLKKAGYTLASADITVAGKLARDDKGWSIVVDASGQRFVLAGPNVEQALAAAKEGDAIELTGDWKTIGTGPNAHETITASARKTVASRRAGSFPVFAKIGFTESSVSEIGPAVSHSTPRAAPIRVTSPGLTVYKGGAVTPRVYFIKQHLGSLEVTRQVFDLSVSYTPSPRLQLEIQAPFSRTAYDDGLSSGSGFGAGNLTAWAKYRFFRTVETYGDRQAALRARRPLRVRHKSTRRRLCGSSSLRLTAG